MDCKISTGSTVSGAITSFGEATEPVTLRLLENGTEVDKVTSIDGTYSFSSVSPGAYTIEVSKINHATRTYEITVEREDVVKDMTIYLFGDVDGDGVCNIRDATLLRRYVAKWDGVTVIESSADVNNDGVVNIRDATILRRHVAKWGEYEDLPYTS